MASLVNRANGTREIRFRSPFGDRRRQAPPIRLGRMPKAAAEGFKRQVEKLITAATLGQPPDQATAEWVAGLSPVLHARVARTGLIQQRGVFTLGGLLDAFMDTLAVKPSTRRNLAIVAANLRTYFDADLPLSDITVGDVQEFRAWLLQSGGSGGGPLERTTVSRRVRRCKQIFDYAVKKRWLTDSPFADEANWCEVNRAKDRFIELDTVAQILEEIPDPEFRAVVLLARVGGLRLCDIQPLRWTDVDWAHNMLRVTSPKTQHHEGGTRLVPLFADIREALAELWDRVEPGAVLVLPRMQITDAALRGRFETACRAAGIVMWPRPFQNMRATRVTELKDEFAPHVVDNWLGHSKGVSDRHYAQVTKEHYARAVKMRKIVVRSPDSGAEAHQKAHHHGRPPALSVNISEHQNAEKQGISVPRRI